MLSTLYKNPEYLIKLYKKNLLFNYKDMDHIEDFSNKIKDLIEVLNDFYKDNWELITVPEIKRLENDRFYKIRNLRLRIWFKDITVENTSNHIRHNMKDFIFEVYLTYFYKHEQNSGLFTAYSLRGNRISYYSTEFFYEMYNIYKFSHLNNGSSKKVESFHDFCYGKSFIDVLFYQLNSKGDIQNAFIQLENYLSKESAEGVPYKYISKIHKSSISKVDLNDNTTIRKVLKDIILDNKLLINNLFINVIYAGDVKIILKKETVDKFLPQLIINYILKHEDLELVSMFDEKYGDIFHLTNNIILHTKAYLKAKNYTLFNKVTSSIFNFNDEEYNFKISEPKEFYFSASKIKGKNRKETSLKTLKDINAVELKVKHKVYSNFVQILEEKVEEDFYYSIYKKLLAI